MVDVKATEEARNITDLASRTPVEIDTALAALDREHYRLNGRLAVVMDDVHTAAGDRKRHWGSSNRVTWQMADTEAVIALADSIQAGTVGLTVRHMADRTYASYTELTEAIHANRAEFNRLNAEYERRRGWTRFIIVQHVHSGIWCEGGTVRPTSERHWLPEYSGMSETDAIAKLASNAHILCTHCFPHAPVITPTVDLTVCTNKVYDPDKPKRTGYAYDNWATCKECGATQVPLTRSWNLRKHKRPETSN